MARQAKLKVFRTPIGFHDAYVAAPSQKAALAAWGSERDLFARGIAELVTDPALTEAPLAEPGKVVRRSRGTAEEQIAALPKTKARRRTAEKAEPSPAPAPPPKPDRDALDEAEAALASAEERFARERHDMERRQARERERLEAARDGAERDYDAALKRWRAA
ncbi:hypothetical protein Q5H91_06115 [Sphingomonas sp. KR1UV-12]|uniref:Cell envelope biogenesis protein TolA n=1 Tax=Sphingomonas aurea TaxID=3063994 RepID=A0ABT9EII4_9SPHN|nr:hypothetical protein [Sphingomonas sp. KR1UV-12]MDP1026778.1 hypothetical protein [Sphingomonas sp. KR1UV-12]